MKDEIKENLSEMLFNRDERLLDYITNLQEENERLKELNVCVGCNNNPDYKSRNEKATTYYYKTLSQYNNQNKKMPDEAVEMFNLLENNK